MRRNWAGKIFTMVMFAIVFLIGFSYLVMRLWNWLTPALFGWHVITFWQAVGLLVLCKILFGGFRGGPGRRMQWRRRMMERWGKMSPEEREQFRNSMGGRDRGRGHCGPYDSSAATPKA